MGNVYAVTFSNVAVTAQQDFFEYVAPSDAVAVIHSVFISQTTEVGDAAEEGLSIQLKRGATVSGSGGSSATPAALEAGWPAAGGTAEINNTSKANTGTIVTLHSEAWNVRAPFVYVPVPEARIHVSPGIRFTVELATTPADSITVSGTLIVEEIGG